MEEITVLEIAQNLGISSDAARKRLNRLKIKPTRYIGSAAMYRKDVLETIRDHGVRGRPKTKPPEKIPPKSNIKKTAKKS